MLYQWSGAGKRSGLGLRIGYGREQAEAEVAGKTKGERAVYRRSDGWREMSGTGSSPRARGTSGFLLDSQRPRKQSTDGRDTTKVLATYRRHVKAVIRQWMPLGLTWIVGVGLTPITEKRRGIHRAGFSHDALLPDPQSQSLSAPEPA